VHVVLIAVIEKFRSLVDFHQVKVTDGMHSPGHSWSVYSIGALRIIVQISLEYSARRTDYTTSDNNRRNLLSRHVHLQWVMKQDHIGLLDEITRVPFVFGMNAQRLIKQNDQLFCQS
jgi:hypothetical protein